MPRNRSKNLQTFSNHSPEVRANSGHHNCSPEVLSGNRQAPIKAEFFECGPLYRSAIKPTAPRGSPYSFERRFFPGTRTSPAGKWNCRKAVKLSGRTTKGIGWGANYAPLAPNVRFTRRSDCIGLVSSAMEYLTLCTRSPAPRDIQRFSNGNIRY